MKNLGITLFLTLITATAALADGGGNMTEELSPGCGFAILVALVIGSIGIYFVMKNPPKDGQ